MVGKVLIQGYELKVIIRGGIGLRPLPKIGLSKGQQPVTGSRTKESVKPEKTTSNIIE